MMRHPDPGLQPERTVMAWTRTLVSFLVVAGLSMRVSASIHDAAFIVITVIAGIAALNIMVRQSGRYRRTNDGLVRSEERRVGEECRSWRGPRSQQRKTTTQHPERLRG